MASPYKRRRPSLLRNLWVYRKLVILAMVLGLMLWFVWANNTQVTVLFPFGLGKFASSVGLVSLLSAIFGAAVSALATAVLVTLRRRPAWKAEDNEPGPLPDDRPPPDYAAKTEDGFKESGWS